MHLTFTGCLGRCDRPAQVLISHADGGLVFAGIDNPSWWDGLIVWAECCAAANRILDPPESLTRHLDHPWSRS